MSRDDGLRHRFLTAQLGPLPVTNPDPPNVLRRCVIGMRPNRRTKASIKPGWERGQLGRCIAPISANLLICTLYLLVRTYLGRVVPNHNIPRHDDPGGEF